LNKAFSDGVAGGMLVALLWLLERKADETRGAVCLGTWRFGVARSGGAAGDVRVADGGDDRSRCRCAAAGSGVLLRSGEQLCAGLDEPGQAGDVVRQWRFESVHPDGNERLAQRVGDDG